MTYRHVFIDIWKKKEGEGENIRDISDQKFKIKLSS